MNGIGKGRVQKMPPLYVRDCECGAPLGFGESLGGKMIALDLRAKVYCPVFAKSDSHGFVVVRTELAYLDHSEICQLG